MAAAILSHEIVGSDILDLNHDDLRSLGFQRFSERKAILRVVCSLRRLIEPLESRFVLSSFIVTVTNDSGAGSLRAVIVCAMSPSLPSDQRGATARAGDKRTRTRSIGLSEGKHCKR